MGKYNVCMYSRRRKCILPFSHPIKLNLIPMSISSSPPLILTFCRHTKKTRTTGLPCYTRKIQSKSQHLLLKFSPFQRHPKSQFTYILIIKVHQPIQYSVPFYSFNWWWRRRWRRWFFATNINFAKIHNSTSVVFTSRPRDNLLHSSTLQTQQPH